MHPLGAKPTQLCQQRFRFRRELESAARMHEIDRAEPCRGLGDCRKKAESISRDLGSFAHHCGRLNHCPADVRNMVEGFLVVSPASAAEVQDGRRPEDIGPLFPWWIVGKRFLEDDIDQFGVLVAVDFFSGRLELSPDAVEQIDYRRHACAHLLTLPGRCEGQQPRTGLSERQSQPLHGPYIIDGWSVRAELPL